MANQHCTFLTGWSLNGSLVPFPRSSDSEEQESTKEDNSALLKFQLKYETDLLFTRYFGYLQSEFCAAIIHHSENGGVFCAFRPEKWDQFSF